MAHSKKLLLALAMSSVALLSAPAQAMVITYGGQAATDGSGLTSAFIPASNTGLASGWFVETFDPLTAAPDDTPLTSSTSDIYIQSGCSVNAGGGGMVNITTTGGGFGVQQGTTFSGAAPAGDGTCYGFGPRPGSGTTSATVKVDYSPLLALSPGVNITYLGLYYGSIDTYNDIWLYDGDTVIRKILGADVLANFGGTSGNQLEPGSNVYVNFAFAPEDGFTGYEFRTTNIAFEVDNVVVGLSNRAEVPEPGSLALLGAGLLGFAAMRRRQRQG